MDFFGISEHYDKLRSKYLNFFDNVYKRGRLFDGNYTKILEEQIQDYCNVKHAIAVGSGSDALFMAVEHSIKEPLGLIAVPNLSFCATAESVLRSEKFVIFIDSAIHNTDKYMMNLTDLKRTQNLRIDGIVYVPLFGLSGNVEEISKYAKEMDITLIEDCAQSIGTKFKDRHVGTFGKSGTFSFDPTKIIPSPNGGGMVITDDDAVAYKIRAMRYHALKADGKTVKLRAGSTMVGMNSRMSEISAAIVLDGLINIEETVLARRCVADDYCRKLKDVPGILLPVVHKDCRPSWSKFVVDVIEEDVEPLQLFLKNKDIPIRVTYKRTQASIFQGNRCIVDPDRALDVSRDLVKHSISLPIYPELTVREVNSVCEGIIEYYERRGA